MRLLLIVGSANDTFIYNYAKWLKAYMNVFIDVFEFYPSSKHNYDYSYYDSVESAKGYLLPIPKGKGLVDSIVRANCLKNYLKGKQYDIIHNHWVVAPVVLQCYIKKHCKKLVLTFWGGEFEKQSIFGSSKLYLHFLNKLSKDVDCIINAQESSVYIRENLPFYKGLYLNATLGSAPLEILYNLMQVESKEEAKKKMDLPVDKLTILIGYSGKAIHRQSQIIKELHEYPELKKKVHILAPMTRGAGKDFVKKIDDELQRLGFSYTLISGKYLSDEEVARLRIATDIAFQLSEWDSFSRSIIECLCAKAVLIYGSWLKYEMFMKSFGFTGIEVDGVVSGVAKMAEIASNIKEYDEMTNKNNKNGIRKTLWSECIKDWIGAYNELLK